MNYTTRIEIGHAATGGYVATVYKKHRWQIVMSWPEGTPMPNPPFDTEGAELSYGCEWCGVHPSEWEEDFCFESQQGPWHLQELPGPTHVMELLLP